MPAVDSEKYRIWRIGVRGVFVERVADKLYLVEKVEAVEGVYDAQEVLEVETEFVDAVWQEK